MTNTATIIAKIFAEADTDKRRALLPTSPDALLDLVEALPAEIVDAATANLALRTVNDLDHLTENYPDLPTTDVKIAAAERCFDRIAKELKLVPEIVRSPEYQVWRTWRQGLRAFSRPGQE